MKAILDRDGTTVGWLDDADLLDLDGAYLGFIEFDGIYDADGSFLGHFFRGLFIDRQGKAIAFTPGATVGPMKPLPRVPPPMPSDRERRQHVRVSLAPRMPLISSAWSAEDWRALFAPLVPQGKVA